MDSRKIKTRNYKVKHQNYGDQQDEEMLKFGPLEQPPMLGGVPIKKTKSGSDIKPIIPNLMQELVNIEHMWINNDSKEPSFSGHPLIVIPGIEGLGNSNPFLVASNLCKVADQRLYQIVKWCKSLSLFKNISIDDQIYLLLNSWCELILFSCCFYSIPTPGEIKVSGKERVTLAQAQEMGLHICVERMLNTINQLRRLRLDKYEYAVMKVIILLTTDLVELRETEKIRNSQEKALKALQEYTQTHSPDIPTKFGELLLLIPEIQRTSKSNGAKVIALSLITQYETENK